MIEQTGVVMTGSGQGKTGTFTFDTSCLGHDAMSSAGILTCLDKPFDKQGLLKLIADILSRRPEATNQARIGKTEPLWMN